MMHTYKNPKVYFSLALALALVGVTGLTLNAPVMAATTQITGGTYGPNCNSGGYFTPSSATVNTGDTVTISVPAGDPYPGGIEIHGFPEGNFTVLPGDSHTTTALSANVSYYRTWPITGCM